MSEQDKYRQALSAVIGITMESLKGGSMSSHTPGPWTAKVVEDFIEGGEGEVVVLSGFHPDGSPDRDKEQSYIAAVSHVRRLPQPVPQAIANARLIAAAPELLAEIQSALATAQDGLEHMDSGDEEGARMALDVICSGLEDAINNATKEEA